MIGVWAVLFAAYIFCACAVVPLEHQATYKAAKKDWLYYVSLGLFYSIPVSSFWNDTDPSPMTLLAGMMLLFGGGGLLIWAMASNPYFSPAIVKPPRVIRNGAYAHLNHPGYLGMGMMAFGSWLMVGADWALIPLAAYLALLMARAWKEGQILDQQKP